MASSEIQQALDAQKILLGTDYSVEAVLSGSGVCPFAQGGQELAQEELRMNGEGDLEVHARQPEAPI